MHPKKVLLDTNVLFSFYLRDLILSLAESQTIDFKWSDAIKFELISSLVKTETMSNIKALELVRTIDDTFPFATVSTSEDSKIKYGCSDADDEHIFHAGVVSSCQSIVTFNISDFPFNAKSEHGIEIISPDDYLTRIYDSDPEAIDKAINSLLSGYTRPEISFDQYCEVLARLNCGQFAKAVLSAKN